MVFLSRKLWDTRRGVLVLGALTTALAFGMPKSALAQSSDPAVSAAPQAAPAPAPRLTPRLRPRPQTAVQGQTAPAKPTVAGDMRLVPAPVATSPMSAPGFLPPVLPAYKNLPPPPGYERKVRFNSAALFGGGTIFLAGYIGGLGFAASRPGDGLGVVAAPLVGPWLALGKRDFTCETSSALDIDEQQDAATECQEKLGQEVMIAAVLAGVGISQFIGTALMVVGVVDRRDLWIRTDLGDVAIKMDAYAFSGAGGLSVQGKF